MPIFDPPPFSEQRRNMVERQIRARDIRDERVLAAMLEVPRHAFIPPEHQHSAYQDRPLAIGEGQTISQPYIVAYMTEKLNIQATDTVLEIGTGSGYQGAILSRLAKSVHTIERHKPLLENAETVCKKLNYNNIEFHLGDGSVGMEEHGPYDAIIVTAAAPEADQALLDQLDDGGRMIIPVGPRRRQHLQLWSRRGDTYHMDKVLAVAFVPLRGQSGWAKSDWH